jgi:hypothetical protein
VCTLATAPPLPFAFGPSPATNAGCLCGFFIVHRAATELLVVVLKGIQFLKVLLSFPGVICFVGVALPSHFKQENSLIAPVVVYEFINNVSDDD